jgi:hypothetical protein
MRKSFAKSRRRLSANRYNANTLEIVMKTIIIIPALIVLIIFAYCSNLSSPEEYNDLVGYQIENHKVYLNAKLSYYFDKDSLEIFSRSFGKPFVLIANGERIYLGSFVTGLSSWVPNTPKIVDYAVNNTEKSFIISGAPYYDQSSFIDVRNDNRIFQALGDKIIQ